MSPTLERRPTATRRPQRSMNAERAPRGTDPAGGACTLTFDDGPDPRWTPRVLAELERCGVPATFFVIGERVAYDPEPARSALRAGHDVELHCHRHVRHTELTEAELEADTVAALAEFERAGLGRPRYWRTPWGARSAATERVAARQGLRLVDWTIDTHDWRGDGRMAMLETADALLEDGAIVLLHDGLGPGALRAGVEQTIGLIAPFAALARDRGLRLTALSQADAPRASERESEAFNTSAATARGVETPRLGCMGMSAAPPPLSIVSPVESALLSIDEALARISLRAKEFDAAPRLPEENLEDLRDAGLLQFPADRERATLREEIVLVRALASADASTARIFDGHLNGVERLALGAPAGLREAELARVAAGKLLLGVWGADPAPGEGKPAQVVRGEGGSLTLRGVKTFCSGAGGVQRALVVVREGSATAPPGGRRLAYVDASEGVEIDRDWYRASGLRSSESHRVEFLETPVLALLGEENELTRQPFFARDGVRTAATWAGIADGIFLAATSALGEREPDAHQLSALGRMRVARGTIDRWLEHAGRRLEDRDMADPAGLATSCRAAIIAASRTIAEEAALACGSRSLIAGGELDRGRRDLDLFLLQHRLDPQLAKLGRATLDAAGGKR